MPNNNVENIPGSFNDVIENRVEAIEARFETKSPFAATLNENQAQLGLNVVGVGALATSQALAATNMTVNKIKNCVVSHGLMEAS